MTYDARYSRKLQAKQELYKRLDRNRIFVEPVFSFVSKKDLILDVGTGLSDIPMRLAAAGYSVWAIDVNEQNNAQLRSMEQTGVRFIAGDFLKYAFHDSFGVIIMKDFLEHFSRDEIERILRRVDTLLHSQGLLIVGCPVRTLTSTCLWFWHRVTRRGYRGVDDTGDETHQQWFTEKALRKQLGVLSNYVVMEIQYLLFGVNNFPRFLISPLARLQKLLEAAWIPSSVSLLLQRVLGFRIMVVLRKV